MQSPIQTHGFCYVANTPSYLAEAMGSIMSLKRHMTEARVCMIAPKELWTVNPLINDWREPRLTDRTPIVKNDATLAPYERVAFVDTDTRFLGCMMDIFAILGAFDLAAAHEPTRGWDYATPAAQAFCELNTGFIVFQNTSKVRTFFDLWLAEYRELLADQGLRNDQPAFRSALWKSREVRFATLPSEYHCIPGKPIAIAWDARLLHDRGDLDFVSAEINRETGYRAYLPGIGIFKPYSGRRNWLTAWIRLSYNWLRVFIRPSRLTTTHQKPHQWHRGELG